MSVAAGGLLPLGLAAGLMGFAFLAILTGSTAAGADRTGLEGPTVTARWIGLIAGGALALLLVRTGWRLGTGPALAPVAFGLCLTIATVVGELAVRPPRARQRVADLSQRTAHRLLPVGPLWLTGGLLAALTMLLVVTTIVASADDVGRPGRSLTTTYLGGQGPITHIQGPFPGSWYSVPIAMAILVLVAVATAGMVVITRRRPAHSAHDHLQRRRSMAAILGGVATTASVTLMAVGLFAYLPTRDAAALLGQPLEYQFATWATGASVLIGLVGAVLGFALVCFPTVGAKTLATPEHTVDARS